MTDLKPCPLCEGKDLLANVEFIPRRYGRGFNIGFVECLTDNCPMIIRAPTIEEAIEKWNHRPIEDKLEKENIKISNDLIYTYKQLSHIKYIHSQMETSPEQDKMIQGIIKEILEKLDGYRR